MKIKIPPLAFHPGQRSILDGKTRFKVISAGRRFGKTMLAIEWLALMEGGAVDGKSVAFFSPTYKLLLDVWTDMERTLKPITRKANKTEMRIELVTGGKVDFWTLEDPDAGRGRKYHRIVIDEAAHARHLKNAWERAIAPTLTDYQGDAWFISTPNGLNYFHELYQVGIDPSKPDWQSWHMPTSTNPHMPLVEIERFRAELPERVFMQEYEAAFLDDGGGVFRNVTRCIYGKMDDRAWDDGDGRTYVIGADWGRHNDFTVYTVIEVKSRRVVAIDRFNQIEYALQLGRLQALHDRFPKAPILAESNSMGGPLIEQLQRAHLPVRSFYTSAQSKSDAILALSVAFERNEIEIPDHPELLGELLAFDQERLPSGAIRYSAPPGKHDDMVMSLAIAWHAITFATPKPINFHVSGL